jgi:hypothetical protein
MKKLLGFGLCALTLLAFASTAQSDGGDASGTFAFDLGTATGTVNFFGHLAHKDDPATGQISLHATIDVSGETCQPVNVGTEENPIYVDVCEPTGNTTPTTVALDFLIDRMVVVDNRAAMSGAITGDSPFNGQHTILAVENASGNDGFTWGVYKTKVVNTNAKDYDFCQGPPDPGVCENSENCPTPSCFCDGVVVCQGESCQCNPGAALTYTATDYELCLYPPPSDTENFVPPDPHNYVCFTGAPDPNGRPAGIPVLATQTITDALSFPLFTYPMTPIPHGGGNKVTVKPNG